MALPPKDVPASTLFQRLISAEPASEVVEYPREGFGKVRIILQSNEAKTSAQFRAQAWLSEKTKGKTLVDQDTVLGDAVARELVALSVHEPEPFAGEGAGASYKRVFADGNAVGKLPDHEINVLFGYYLLIQQKYGPGERDFESDEEVNAWIETLSEGASRHAFLALDSFQQVALCTKLAERGQALGQILSLTGEELASFLESVPASWSLDTTSPGREPVDSSDVPTVELITPERAMELAKRLGG